MKKKKKENRWFVIENVLILRREEFASLQHRDEKVHAFNHKNIPQILLRKQ